MSLPPSLSLYRLATDALGPFARAWLDARAKAGKEDPARLPERFGMASTPRPAGPLAWLHGASVGETKVALLLAETLTRARPDLTVLITSGTRTSAQIAAKAAGPRLIHQYAPLDRIEAVRRFLAHWRPQLGVFAESELWPNTLLEARAQGVPLALVNARLSTKSRANWARAPDSARAVLSQFAFIAAAEDGASAALHALSGKPVPMLGNLKLAADPLPVDEQARTALREAICARPVWLAASTHPGEDEIVLAAHAHLRRTDPDALLMIAPRHPDRGGAVAALAQGAPQRSAGDRPRPEHPVYVADTIGEMGVLFSCAPVSLVCGSLLEPLKGHNPIEPCLLGSAALSGPHIESFADVYATLVEARGVTIVSTVDAITAQVGAAWRDEPARMRQIEAARAVIAAGRPALDATTAALLRLLPETDHAAA